MSLSQSELNRAVARATGESISTIQRLGFLLADQAYPADDQDFDLLGAQVIDWDALALQRQADVVREAQLAIA